MADDDTGLDQIEHYLLNAPILDRSAFQGHGAHRSELFILSGGVGALCKPEDGIGEGRIAVTREVAAWRIARVLGWTDLMAATVLREIDPDRMASLTVLWPEPDRKSVV